MDADTPAVSVVPIESLLPDAANVRRRDAETERMLVSSLKQFGAGRSIVLDGNDVVKAGNGTLKAAVAAGKSKVVIVEPGPDEIVAVRRPDWSPSEATAYAIADNQLGIRATWDEEALGQQLQSLADEGFDYEPMGFALDEAKEYVSDDSGAIEEGEWPEHAKPDSHSIVVRYRDEDVPVLLRFLGETDDAVLVEGKAGVKILGRIREVAPG